MIAVIFEVFPKEENKQEYLDIAAKLKPMLVAYHCPKLENTKEEPGHRTRSCNMLNKPTEQNALYIINHKKSTNYESKFN